MNQLHKISRSKFIVIILVLIINCFLLSNNTLAQPINNSQRIQKVWESIELDTNLILSGAEPQKRQELKTEKYARMSESVFDFFRATNSLFWQDFINDSRLGKFGNTKTKTWILGDCHIGNFGAYNNDKEEIIFDLNDFDESIVADYQYDLWRLATSIILVAEDNSLKNKSDQKEIIDNFSDSYLHSLKDYVGNDHETEIYFTQKNSYGEVENTIKKAAKDTREKMLNKWSKVVDNKRLFDIDNNEDLGIANDAEKAIKSQIISYSDTLSSNVRYSQKYFTVKDVAQRLNAGLGSLGTPRYYLLIEGKTDDLDDDHILDIKRQYKPTAYGLFSLYDRLNYDSIFVNTAQRHAIAYKALIKHTDDFLGWMKLVDKNLTDGDFSGYYSVREISPNKESLKTYKLEDKNSFIEVAKQLGEILATDHARADQDFDEKLVPNSLEKQVKKITDGRGKEFRELVSDVALHYAEQVNIDYSSFVNRYNRYKEN